MNYDIHIYWRNNDERSEALALQKVLIENNVQTFPFVEKNRAHPYPMLESHDTNQTLPIFEPLLSTNRKSCSILIHEKIGEPLELNFDSSGTSSAYFFIL